MSWQIGVVTLLSTAVWSAPAASAQDRSVQVRFTTAVENTAWQGYIDRLSADSLYLRIRGTDTVVAFSRSEIRSLERERQIHPGRAAGFGCLALGIPLGAIAYTHTHDPDSPGLEKVLGVVGFGIGCGVGALGGFIGSVSRAHDWEPWVFPDSM
jgi:hypothetical protein